MKTSERSLEQSASMTTELKILNLAFRPLSDQEDEDDNDTKMDGGDPDMDGEDTEEDEVETSGAGEKDFPEEEEA